MLIDDDPHQREVGIKHRGPGREPRHHEQIDQHDDRDQKMRAAQKDRPQRLAPDLLRKIIGGQPAQAQLAGFQMRDIKQRHVGDHGRYQCVHQHLEVGDADQLGDDEGRRAHDRRHDLAVGRGRDLNRARLGARKAGLFHHRDGKGARGDHIGDRRAGDRAGHARGQDRGLGRAAAIFADHREGEVQEITPGPGAVQKSAEQHEQEHEADRDINGNAEDRLAGKPVIADQPLQRDALMRDHIRHLLAEDGIDQEHGGHDHQRQPDRAAGGLQQHEHAQPADDRLDRHAADLQQDAAAGTDAGVIEIDIQRGGRGDQGQGDIAERDPVAEGFLRTRKQQKREQQAKTQMDRPRGHAARGGKAQGNGEGRGDEQLKQRPGGRDNADDQGITRRESPARVLKFINSRLDIILTRVGAPGRR